jgi:hypothetical protein
LVTTELIVTLSPGQITVCGTEINATGTVLAETVIPMLLDVTVLVVAHASLEVNSTDTWSPEVSDEFVYTLLFEPTGAPFNNHWYTGEAPPLVALAVKVTVVPAQIVVLLAATETVGVTTGCTVITTLFDVALVGAAHAASEVTIAETTSPFVNEVELNEALFTPCAIPLMYHSYTGVVPPPDTDDVKFTFVPAQIVFADAAMESAGLTGAFTVIAILLDVTVLVVAHASLEVNSTDTWSPEVSDEFVYTLLFEPTGAPFNNHWYTGEAPPLVALAVKVTVVPAQIVVLLAATETVGVTTGCTVITTLFDVALVGAAHAASEVTIAETTSPFINEDILNEVLFTPCAIPLMYHSYKGVVPPPDTDDVKFTLVPAQIVFAEAAMESAGLTGAFTVIAIVLEVTVLAVAHASLEVNSTDTWSPEVNVELV